MHVWQMYPNFYKRSSNILFSKMRRFPRQLKVICSEHPSNITQRPVRQSNYNSRSEATQRRLRRPIKPDQFSSELFSLMGSDEIQAKVAPGSRESVSVEIGTNRWTARYNFMSVLMAQGIHTHTHLYAQAHTHPIIRTLTCT